MSTPLKQALIEAAWLIQAFVAALEALRLGAFFHNWSTGYQYLIFSLPPILALCIMYICFLQIRLGYGAPSKKLEFRLELGKSGIVTALWLWFFVESLLGLRSGAMGFVPAVVSLVVPCGVFYPTLVLAFLAWRRGRGAGISL